ncbi:MAG: tetratricopeptide repeat protein [Neomegalonema sp.]|nr:tetratricopeptide repeat protein [Neomegalonema sp.]
MEIRAHDTPAMATNGSTRRSLEDQLGTLTAQIKQEPTRARLYAERSMIAIRLGAGRLVLDDAKRAYRLAPDRADYARRWVVSALKYGSSPTLIAEAGAASEKFWPEDSLLALLAGRALVIGRQEAMAALALCRAMERKRKSLAWCRTVVNASEDMKDKALALAVAIAAHKRLPERAELALEAAKVADLAGDPRAEQFLDKAIALRADYAAAHRLRGVRAFEAGNMPDAIAALRRAIALKPEPAGPYEKLSKALWREGQFDEAADAMLEAVARRPEDPAWHRRAAIALLSAGRDDEAQTAFDHSTRLTGAGLSDCLTDDLLLSRRSFDPKRLSRKVVSWAWSLADQDKHDFTQWQRRAHRGLRANHILRDWIEARPEQSHQITALIDPVDAHPLAEARSLGKGVLIVGAHVGPFFAAPLMLEELGFPWQWIASNPPLGPSPALTRLISTATHSDQEISARMRSSLEQGELIYLLMDGRQYRKRRMVMLHGVAISFPRVGARLAYEHGIPSVYLRSAWQKGRLSFTFHKMPLPKAGEAFELFDARWTERFFEYLCKHLAGAPENLTLSGGIWDAVRR